MTVIVHAANGKKSIGTIDGIQKQERGLSVTLTVIAARRRAAVGLRVARTLMERRD